MGEPRIIMDDYKGFHNSKPHEELVKGCAYKDKSCVMVVPSRGSGVPIRVVQSWLNLLAPMNQKFMRIFIENMEVGEAYNTAIQLILDNPELSKWKYILTLEEDNLVSPDALLKLLDSIEETNVDAVGALYWTKGEGGKPMCYGDPNQMPKNFIPFLPHQDRPTPCNGLGMGATLFKLDMFKDPKLPKPWFKTLQEYVPGQGVRAYTQDLYFFENAGKVGKRFMCDGRICAGHLDSVSGVLW